MQELHILLVELQHIHFSPIFLACQIKVSFKHIHLILEDDTWILFVSVLFLFLVTLMPHVDDKPKGEPIDNLDKGDNTETQVESKNPSKTGHKVGES